MGLRTQSIKRRCGFAHKDRLCLVRDPVSQCMKKKHFAHWIRALFKSGVLRRKKKYFVFQSISGFLKKFVFFSQNFFFFRTISPILKWFLFLADFFFRFSIYLFFFRCCVQCTRIIKKFYKNANFALFSLTFFFAQFFPLSNEIHWK